MLLHNFSGPGVGSVTQCGFGPKSGCSNIDRFLNISPIVTVSNFLLTFRIQIYKRSNSVIKKLDEKIGCTQYSAPISKKSYRYRNTTVVAVFFVVDFQSLTTKFGLAKEF
jgi:hypothetical protein